MSNKIDDGRYEINYTPKGVIMVIVRIIIAVHVFLVGNIEVVPCMLVKFFTGVYSYWFSNVVHLCK